MIFEITNIKRFVNKSNEIVEILKRDDPNDRVTLLPNSENFKEEIHIPWVDNQTDFDRKTIEIRYKESKKIIYIWQHGEKIRCSENGYENPGSAITGKQPNAGGDRILEIEKSYVTLD